MKKTDIKMRYLVNFIAAAAMLFIITGCSELQDDITPAGEARVHPAGFKNPNHPNFHGDVIKNEYNWDMKSCQQCHAANFSGGITEQSCLGCHSKPAGPAACNTCHGDFGGDRSAPPRDLSENVETSARGVGAHTRHLYETGFSREVECAACHAVPNTLYAPGHIDDGKEAEVLLKELASANAASTPEYNKEEMTCSNTYCHGNFEFAKADADPTNQFAYTADKMSGNNRTVRWNKVDGTEAECGSCHDLPPVGHIGYGTMSVFNCVSCHPTVIDEFGNIIDKEKHVNGIKNARTE